MSPARTPEQLARKAEYARAYRERNKEQIAEYHRNRQRSFTPEQLEANRDRSRAYYAANKDKAAERARRYQVKNKEKIAARTREYRGRNRDKIRAQSRAYHQQNNMFRRHGMWPEDWAALWVEQDGRCYLCGSELIAEKTHIDHDHSCCGRDRSCEVCRRGLACWPCNGGIGLLQDDPARLRRMADALEAAQRGVIERMADHGTEQLTLL